MCPECDQNVISLLSLRTWPEPSYALFRPIVVACAIWFIRVSYVSSYRQFRISLPSTDLPQDERDPWTNYGYAPSKASNSGQEVTEENEETVELDDEADERPSE